MMFIRLFLFCSVLYASCSIAQLDAGVVCNQPGLTVPVTECYALVSLYNSTGGDDWPPLTTPWGSTPDVEHWDFITEDNGHVTRINLNGFLMGTIPPEIGDFPELQILFLSGSGLVGTIPFEIGNLTKLERLTITDSEVSGQIPSSIGNLVNVTDLTFNNNLLTGELPEELGMMSSLDDLFLVNNHLSGNFPTGMANLNQMTRLVVSRNHFTGTFPIEWANLTGLNVFDVEQNHLDAENNGDASIPAALLPWIQAIPIKNLCCQTNESQLPPFINGYPKHQTTTHVLYQFTPFSGDPNPTDQLSFSIVNLPSWANFNDQNGALSGTPSDSDIGLYSDIVISVSDGLDQVSLQSFDIEVIAGGTINNPPMISGSPATEVSVNQLYQFQPSATDPDINDSLTFTISNQPSWINFSTTTGLLSGTPTNSDIGIYSGIVISVSDGQVNTSLPAFSIEVSGAGMANIQPVDSLSSLGILLLVLSFMILIYLHSKDKLNN